MPSAVSKFGGRSTERKLKQNSVETRMTLLRKKR